MGSCDLNQIKNKGYEVYLEGNATLSQRPYHLRYYSNGEVWSYVKTSNISDFTLKCKNSGNWVMKKTASSCQGTPTLSEKSYLYKDYYYILIYDHNFFVKGVNDIHKLTSNTITGGTLAASIASNGTKIEACCEDGYTEYDDNGIGYPSRVTLIHYYECVNGNWVTRGSCRKN